MKNSKKDVSNSKNMGILYVPCKKCGGFPQLDFISDGEEKVVKTINTVDEVGRFAIYITGQQ